jgi:hypothetical protein
MDNYGIAPDQLNRKKGFQLLATQNFDHTFFDRNEAFVAQHTQFFIDGLPRTTDNASQIRL